MTEQEKAINDIKQYCINDVLLVVTVRQRIEQVVQNEKDTRRRIQNIIMDYMK